MNLQTTENTSQFQYTLASRKERWRALVLTLGAVPVFTLGFIPAAQNLYHWLAALLPLPGGRLGNELSFPLLALFFHLSFRSRRISAPALRWSLRKMLLTCVLPLVISFVFGRFHPGAASWWNCLFVPIGEECLFRGWFYTLFDKLFRGKLMTLTNPLPLGIWMSALAFSLWHLQNLGLEPWRFVLFQVGYTFFVGIWLGVLRWQTGNLAVPVAAHVLLNVAVLQ